MTSFGHLICTERPSDPLERVRDRDSGEERELGRVSLGRRLQQHGEEQRGSGRRLPAAAEPAASRRLVIRDDERALGQRRVDEQLRRLAGLDVEARLAELLSHRYVRATRRERR